MSLRIDQRPAAPEPPAAQTFEEWFAGDSRALITRGAPARRDLATISGFHVSMLWRPDDALLVLTTDPRTELFVGSGGAVPGGGVTAWGGPLTHEKYLPRQRRTFSLRNRHSARLVALGWVADEEQLSATWQVQGADADTDVAEVTDVVMRTLSAVYGVKPTRATLEVFASVP